MTQEEKEIMTSLLSYYNDVVSMCSRITSGNLSHKLQGLKCYLSSVTHLINKYHPDNELALKHYNMFNGTMTKCDRITTGNVTHEIALIKGWALNYSHLFKELLEENK